MLLIPVLFALATQTAPAVTIAGRTVPITSTPAPPVLPQEVTGWSGWGPFTGDRGDSALTPVLTEQALATPLAADAVDWHVKIALFTTSDVVDKEGSVVRSHRAFMADPELDATLRSIVRLPGAVAAATGGKVRIVLDVSLESDPARDSVSEGTLPFGAAWRQTYFGPRINGGVYEAEDKVFRGPYPSVILSVPGYGDTRLSEANGAPVAVALIRQDGSFDKLLYDAWVATAEARSAQLGYGMRLGGSVPWKDLASGDPPNAEDVKRLAESPTARTEPFASPFQMVGSQLGPNGNVSIVTDLDRGPVLRLSENGPRRVARIGLPLPKEWPADANVLTFWYRSEGKEPISVGAWTGVQTSSGGKSIISLGRDHRAYGASPPQELDVPSDGKWHKVGIDLKGLTANAPQLLWIGPSVTAGIATDTAVVPPSWDFASFALEKEGATSALPAPKADLTSADAEDRLLTLPGANTAALGTALTDPNADVRLTAATLLLEKSDPTAAPALLAAANAIDSDLARVAVRAYAKLDLLDERGQLLRLLKFGVTGAAKSEAAFALAETKEPKLAGEIMNLLANRSGEVRKAAADALGMLPGREPGIIRTAFLRQEDPGIKLSVTMSADGNDEAQASKLRWSAVNEPSDMVRLWSAIRLIPSTLPEARRDGYGVVRDESFFVRMKLVEWMGEHPNEAHRPSLRLALTDKSPLVRAAAVAALKKQAVGPTAEELKPVMNDPDPRVRVALGT